MSSTAAIAFDETPQPKIEPACFELPSGTSPSTLPLRSQATTIEIAGVLARIHIEQTWENAGPKPIDVNYVFPTSTHSALHDLRLQIGDQRELRAEIHAKEEAQKLYDAARNDGKTAGLLEQQRPNVLTMHLANVMPGDRIKVTIEASEIARSVDGVYELALPQTVGPRYPGNAGSEAFTQNAYVTGDASTPTSAAVLSTSIAVTLRSPTCIYGLGSPSHAVAPTFIDAHEAHVELSSNRSDVVADRDFVLRWRLADNKTETGVLLFRDKQANENFFLLLGAPPPTVTAKEAPPRDVVFVVDVSGSMRGFPIGVAKKLVGDLTGELRERDRFNMLFFSGGNKVFAPEGSVPATQANIKRALNDLDHENGTGITELLAAMNAAFALPKGEVDGVKRARLVVVVTDGFITAERAAYDLVREKRSDATLVAFGVGSSVNRQLIEGLAKAGGTESFVVLDENQGARAVEHFRTVTSRPALTNIHVKFDGFDAHDLEPPAPPDLYAGRALVMLGRFTGPSSGRVVVTGDGVDGHKYEHAIPIEDNLERPSHSVLRPLWARERIARLADRGRPSAADLDEVQRLGLRYRLLTERTSFVVVDPNVRNDSRNVDDVDQPSVAPKGVAVGRKTTIAFSDVAIEGELNKPEGSYVANRKKSSFKNFVSVQEMSPTRDEAFGSGYGASALAGRSGQIDLGGRGKNTTRIVPGSMVYEGSLSREEIQRVISRVMSQLKYCYEKELNRDPSLAGKLVLQWTIGGDGTVKAVVVSSNAIAGDQGKAVADCATHIISRLQFPKPAGGGQVTVTYPFMFATSQ